MANGTDHCDVRGGSRLSNAATAGSPPLQSPYPVPGPHQPSTTVFLGLSASAQPHQPPSNLEPMPTTTSRRRAGEG